MSFRRKKGATEEKYSRLNVYVVQVLNMILDSKVKVEEAPKWIEELERRLDLSEPWVAALNYPRMNPTDGW